MLSYSINSWLACFSLACAEALVAAPLVDKRQPPTLMLQTLVAAHTWANRHASNTDLHSLYRLNCYCCVLCCADWAFNHCKSTHAPANGTGWFGIWDVDEFVYPCMRPGRQLQGRNLIWEAYNASTKAGADGHALHCSLFGQNHNDTAQGNDTLVLVNNIRRAPDSRSEPAAAPKAWEAVAEGCNKCGCCQVTSRKTIYNVKTVSFCRLGLQQPPSADGAAHSNT
jgi:hypothetical protein